MTRWEAASLSTVYTRGGNAPFAIGQSRLSDLWGRQFQFSDTLSWTAGGHYLRFGGSIIRHTSGGTGSEPGQAVLGTFTFKNSTTAPFSQLTLNDVQNYSQPINFGIDSYKLSQWLLSGFVQDDWKVRRDLTLNLGLRYDRQTLTQADTNFAPRLGFGWNPGGDAKTADPRRLCHVLHSDPLKRGRGIFGEWPRRPGQLHGSARGSRDFRSA